jgi:hypothetical protein
MRQSIQQPGAFFLAKTDPIFGVKVCYLPQVAIHCNTTHYIDVRMICEAKTHHEQRKYYVSAR